jgi:hypothetical protein
MKTSIIPMLAIMALCTQVRAAALKVGDAAPKLQVSKWVQAEPVKAFERDNKAYVVEFWATWGADHAWFRFLTSTGAVLMGTIKPGLSVRGWPEARGISNLIQT